MERITVKEVTHPHPQDQYLALHLGTLGGEWVVCTRNRSTDSYQCSDYFGKDGEYEATVLFYEKLKALCERRARDYTGTLKRLKEQGREGFVSC